MEKLKFEELLKASEKSSNGKKVSQQDIDLAKQFAKMLSQK